ncbi:3-hydroxyacyl-CoA dehydrogenase NAD-binding domain-containing protein [Novosphingobium taihuense]|uniref:3-hydroxyacyl-CoA dehydrogenase n=1 Tax=Novosphingobium taihuense TaxID=260085 RepID=A0A7W7AFE1_9SPHN|nr:3-hydroxyacyl-CoA dehydrogenase NAD-binding domain-containing protein [Novosphingobium taihuense]MBB4615057.1 3-hydroxyacyl-CoA dehydrogenase [Novosphingobium taihuense]TWH79290.1 3-hydroxyacyl-CoA dehydrogenase [Novosphingobium taihuense]
MSAVAYEVDGEVAVLTVNYPPVNALSAAVRTGLGEGIERALADDAVKALVILGGGKTFIAGADITEFGTDKSQVKPALKDLQKMLETSPKLTIAAIHGTALGGGLELALTCHARVAVASAKVGLPEVNLGILPGAGGTQRLPRLTGVDVAIDLITSGKHIPAAKARELGVVDAIVDDVRSGAVAFARESLASGKSFVAVIDRNEKINGIEPSVFAEARKTVGKKARGKIAPMVIIDCIEAACTLPAAEGLAFEAEKFQELYASDQRGALMHYFFAERQARKIPGISADVQPRKIASCAIIGAGTMGGGIAMCFANAGIPVTLLDLNQEALDRGIGVVRKNYGISVSRGSMSQDKMDKALSLITPTTSYDDLAQCDIVIEAALERMDVKKEIFARLDKLMKPGAILATNTSYLSIDEIASATSRPGDVVGCHFFSPANVMKLLENVRSAVTSPETIVTVMEMGKAIGKVPVLAGSTEGFIGNRMLQYYTGEAEFLLEQGATPEQIDRVATKFGMAMGPMSMRDLAGMDMAVVSRKGRAASIPAGERVSPIVERLVEAGRFGQKTNKGFYRYEGREKLSDPETMEIIEGVSKEFGITRREFTDEEVEARLFAPLVNEGAKEIEDGTAIRASDIDVAWVNGYGFPVHRGGPMYWGEKYGLDKIYQMALDAEKRNGPRWGPGKLLERLAKEGKGWKDA